MAHWYLAALAHPYDVIWNLIGFVGQALFGVRLLIQWLRASRKAIA